METTAPSTNQTIYCLLYEIETSLRELIIESLTALNGPHWYTGNRIPSDLLPKFKDFRKTQRTAIWTSVVFHHPIYYLDFLDMRKIFVSEPNWRDAFRPVFQRKDVIDTILSMLEPIRNTVAHNRIATEEDVTIVTTSHSQLASILGPQRLQVLSTQAGMLIDIRSALNELAELLQATFDSCCGYHSIPSLDYWQCVRGAWWFHATYLDYDLDHIFRYFCLLEEYQILPRARGSGHHIQRWIQQSDLCAEYRSAKSTVDVLINMERPT